MAILSRLTLLSHRQCKMQTKRDTTKQKRRNVVFVVFYDSISCLGETLKYLIFKINAIRRQRQVKVTEIRPTETESKKIKVFLAQDAISMVVDSETDKIAFISEKRSSVDESVSRVSMKTGFCYDENSRP